MGDENGNQLAGAEVDLRLGNLLVEVGAGIAKMNGFLASLQKEWEYQRKGPIQVNMDASATTAATFVPLWLDLGGPAYGRAWEVRQLLISSNYISQAVAGTVEILISPTAMPGLEPPAAWLQDFNNLTTTPAIPMREFYSSGQFRVRHPNHVFVVIIGGAASTAYQATGDALDLPDLPARQTTGI